MTIQKQDRNEWGYTMIEVMIVLSMLIVMMGIVVIHMKPMKQDRELKQFIQLLTSDLHYAQQFALTEKIPVQIKFNNLSEQYTIQTSPLNKIKTVQYPEHVFFEEITSKLVIEYHRNGTIQKGGTILLRSETKTYKIVFHLGKGRFYIEQL